MDKILGIVNLHSTADFGNVTQRKNIETVSLLGRYYFIDFVLSRFTNCNINSIEILVKSKPTNLFKHLSLGAKEWSVNTQIGGINLMYNELESKKNYINTDFNTLLANKKYLYNYNHAFVVVAPCDILSDIDYQKMMEAHIMSGKTMTIAYKHCSNSVNQYKEVDKIKFTSKNKYLDCFVKDENNPDVYMETFIIHRTKLIEILENFDQSDDVPTFKNIVSYLAKVEDVNTYEHVGFMRYFRTLENYVEYSLDMLNEEHYKNLFDEHNPIYTRGYNTTPTIYGTKSDVQRCFIANGCHINGKVTNSILGRNVIVDEGATINNSIIFSYAHIKKGSVVEDAIIENGSIVNEKAKVKGSIKKPAYIQNK